MLKHEHFYPLEQTTFAFHNTDSIFPWKSTTSITFHPFSERIRQSEGDRELLSISMLKENKRCLFFISGLAVNILAFVEGLFYNYSSCSVKATTDNRQKSEQGSVPVKFIFTKASAGTVWLLTGLCWTLVLTTHTVSGWFSWTKYLLKTYYMWSPGD